MKNVILFLCCLIFLVACDKDKEALLEEILPSNTGLLAGTQSKTWYMHSQTPEDEDCPLTMAIHSDNTWTFFADGSFEYSNGTIKEEPGCPECCGDLVNIIGTWEFTDEDEGIEIITLGEKDNPENTFEFKLMWGDFDVLEESKFILRGYEPEEEIEYVTEFRVAG